MDADGPTIDGTRPDTQGGTGADTEPDTRKPQQGSLPLSDEPRGEVGKDKARNGKGRPSWLETMEAAGRPTEAAAEVEPSEEPEEPEGAESSELEPEPAPVATRPAVTEKAGRAGSRRFSAPDAAPSHLTEVDEGIEWLRAEARHAGRADAEIGVPGPDASVPTDSEMELRERCRGFFQRWFAGQKREALEKIAGAEERAAEKLGRISLGIDRFQRLTNELIRLKARYSVRKEEVTEDLATEGSQRPRGIPTKVYALALAFLGMVEFFANAPVFSALLPRDPLTERQIRVLTEMSEGWFAGAERVLAQIVFRPDAALLAAGVITFLCVLCHFFGGSLRELAMQRSSGTGRYTVQGRSTLENVVPLVLTSLGLILVLGVLYQARLDLGEVGEERYQQDMAQVEEFRREASWLRVDGELLSANQLTNRADDLQAAAVELREYSQSMARMSFPILLLNLTLVLCAISAAYFHRRDARREHFNELPFEEERMKTIDRAEDVAADISAGLADVVRDIREIKSLVTLGPGSEWGSIVHQLESVVTLYRVENGRSRGMDPQSLPAFATPPRLDIEPPELGDGLATRGADEYENERADLARRFNEVRDRFNEEASATWV